MYCIWQNLMYLLYVTQVCLSLAVSWNVVIWTITFSGHNENVNVRVKCTVKYAYGLVWLTSK